MLALLTIDVQEDFARLISGTRECVPAMRRVLAAFRERGLPIVHVVRLYLPDGSNADLCRRESIRNGPGLVAPGSDGAELLEGLIPDGSVRLDAELLLNGGFQKLGENEWAMYKPRWDAFHASPLEEHLRKLGVTTVGVIGCNFPNCPRTTIYGASMRDFCVAIFPGAISGIYDRGIEELANIGVVAMSLKMFERYNEKARRSIFFARWEASQFGSPEIEPEHLLLGLARHIQLPGDAFRAEMMQAATHKTPIATSVDMQLSPALKRAMARASEEADQLGHQHIGAEHLLLGLMVDDAESVVPNMLQRHGIDRAKVLSGLADAPPEAPIDRESLKALVNSLPPERLRGAKDMLEHMQILRPLPPPPPFGVEGGGFGGGAGWRFMGPGTRATPQGPMRQGRRSRSRMEDGVEVVETRHLRDGCEITLIERFRLSEDGKTLSYTQEITGPAKTEQHTIDFEVSQEGGKNPG